jgi:hypothetical protein
MLQTVISFLATAIFLTGMGLLVVGFYQQSMFISEWYEDHAPPGRSIGSSIYRGLLSTQALFSPFLSERCRRRRRRLLMVTGGACVLIPIAVVLSNCDVSAFDSSVESNLNIAP